MKGEEQYILVSRAVSRLITEHYSSSFGLASRLLDEPVRTHIYNIYGLVRVADELVDSLRPRDMRAQLDDFERQTLVATRGRVSLNPVIASFAQTARQHKFPAELIKAFFASMRADIDTKSHTSQSYGKYVYGSAEVVGLMCLCVFVGGNQSRYSQLKPSAQALGAAFQKVNFLRDLAHDSSQLGRIYFPGVSFARFDDEQKQIIVHEIRADFALAHKAVTKLPYSSRYATALAYWYFYLLLRKLERTPAQAILQKRLRLGSFTKLTVWLVLGVRRLFQL